LIWLFNRLDVLYDDYMDVHITRKLKKSAYRIAKQAHKNQKDKAGKKYMQHIRAVTRMVKTPEQKIVALLHDVVEDSDYKLDDLRREGFPETIVRAVDAVTKRPQEPYRDYIARVMTDPIAVAVKIADATHNGDLRRIKNPTGKDMIRSARYRHTVNVLRLYIENKK